MKRSICLVLGAAVSMAAAACSRSASSHATTTTATAAAPTTAAAAAHSCNVALQATDVGVTPTAITIDIMADVGSPLAPGIFQGAVDAINAFASDVNAHGGLACRKLKVRMWDSRLDPAESKDGQIDACQNAIAMVGTTAGLNTDISTLNTCADNTGRATGLPDIAGFSSEDPTCGPTVFTVVSVAQTCPVAPGDNIYTEPVGYIRWQLQQNPGLHGLFLIAGDVPALTIPLVPVEAAYQQAGVTWDAIPKVYVTNTQTQYTPDVQIARTKQSTYVFNAADDTSMIFIRREAAAQGETSVKVWGCPTSCYTKAFLDEGGSAVEGTYVWLDFLPFEEASYNTEDAAYVNGVGLSKADTYGAYAWQAAVAFEDAVNAVVAKAGPNGVTRANLLTALKGLTHFDAHGWLGAKSLYGTPSTSPCFVVLQVQNGKFVRVFPTKPGTLDCDPSNLATVTIDAAAAAAKLTS